MPLESLASYPNSRSKPRSASTEGETKRVIVNGNNEAVGTNLPDGGIVTANQNTLILPADNNRTAVELRNVSQSESMVYSYADNPDIDQNIAQTGGFTLGPKESISLDVTVAAVWGRSLSANRVNLELDIGRG